MAEGREEKNKVDTEITHNDKTLKDVQEIEQNQENSKSISDLEKDISKLSITESSQDEIPHETKCPICHDQRLHSITLPCGHSFCYLCIKGVFARQRVCAICRQPIPSNAINRPPSFIEREERKRNGAQWYYQAKSDGWWLYEERISNELETSYQLSNTTKVNVHISGFLYTIDFERMIQYRRDKPDRIRRIKRSEEEEEEENLVRGVAGIPLEQEQS